MKEWEISLPQLPEKVVAHATKSSAEQTAALDIGHRTHGLFKGYKTRTFQALGISNF